MPVATTHPSTATPDEHREIRGRGAAAPAAAEGKNANGQRNTQGRVTSTYHSPTLNKGIAMGLVLNGPDRMGEVIDFAAVDGKTMIGAKIVSPVFFDPDGEKQNV